MRAVEPFVSTLNEDALIFLKKYFSQKIEYVVLSTQIIVDIGIRKVLNTPELFFKVSIFLVSNTRNTKQSY